MRKTIVFILFAVLAVSAKAQIISQFTWNSNPVTASASGPPATLVSGNPSSVTGGVGGTNGLSANGNGNFVLTVPGTNFTLPGLDISIDFQKEENGASFFSIGGLDFGIATGAIYVDLPFSTGTVTLNSIMAVPSTGWHTYRIVYNKQQRHLYRLRRRRTAIHEIVYFRHTTVLDWHAKRHHR